MVRTLARAALSVIAVVAVVAAIGVAVPGVAFAAGLPTAVTSPATNLTKSTATLTGSGNPGGDTTTAWFRYSAASPGTCNDAFGTRAPTVGGTAVGSGTTEVAYTQNITGLIAGTTYYYCAVASNSVGTGLGNLLSFTTPATTTATTSAATSITSTSATLNGSGNPSGAATTGWFRYSTTNPGTCNDTFGTRAPATGGTGLGSGTNPVLFAWPISGLAPGTTYYVCAIVSNTNGTTPATITTFTTTTSAPTTTTSAVTNLTKSTATLAGSANPGGDATTAWFRYSTASPGTCNDTFGTRTPATGGTALGSGTTTVPFTQNITGLTPATTYYYCAIAANSAGTSLGNLLSFITPLPPTATTSAATSITGSSASLNGSGNPNRATAIGWFRYASTNPGTCNDTFGTRAPATGGTSLGADIYDQPYSQNITGLTPATYYYCAIVSSTQGTAFGTILSFTTTGAPNVQTSAATSITSSAATLNGSANPKGAATTGWFRYSTTNPGTCNDTFGTRAPTTGGTALGSGTTNMPFSQPITALTTGTTYYVCAIASNTNGTTPGSITTFTTTTSAPTTTTSAVTNLTKSTATLAGSANPGGDATTAWFRYSTASPGTCNDTFGTRAPATGGTALGSGTTTVPFTQNITGLVQATTYYYCAIATNSAGTSLGTVLTFITPLPPTATTSAATSITGSSASLNGSGNPNRATAIGWFRYASTNPGTCNDTFGTRAPATGGTSLGADIYDQPYSQNITGLTPATYYYCAIVSSTQGTAFGTILSFTTTGAPNVQTSATTSITSSAATLNGSANPKGAATTGWFRYSTTNPGTCNDTFGTRTPVTGGTALGSGTTNMPFSQPITALTTGTTYYVCAIASNANGTTPATITTFTAGSP